MECCGDHQSQKTQKGALGEYSKADVVAGDARPCDVQTGLSQHSHCQLRDRIEWNRLDKAPIDVLQGFYEIESGAGSRTPERSLNRGQDTEALTNRWSHRSADQHHRRHLQSLEGLLSQSRV